MGSLLRALRGAGSFPRDAHLDEPTRGRIRAAQLGGILRFTPLTMLVNLVNGALIVYTLQGLAAPRALLAWSALLAFVIAVALRGAVQRRGRAPRTYAPARSFRRMALHSGILAAVWALVPIVWFPSVPPDAQLVLATVIAGMICAGGFALATVPSAATSYLVVLSLGSLTGIALSTVTYRWILIGFLFAYAGVVLRSALGTARLFIDRFVAEIDVEERGQVIALLLAEFEENGSDWLFELDHALRIVKHSPRFAEVCLGTSESLHGCSLHALIERASGDALRERKHAGRPFRNLEVSAQGPMGVRWWTLSASPIVSDGGEVSGWRGVGSDITEMRRANDEITWMAQTDILTGLCNRWAFRERVAEALIDARRDGRPMAIACLDLDHFKLVNDTLGHPVGDTLLRDVSAKLMAFAPERVLVGRLGGDEFGILIREFADDAELAALSQALIASVGGRYFIQGSPVTVGASVGIACGPEDGDTVDALIRNADLALYRSKEHARGSATRYSVHMLQEAEERRAVREDLVLGLARSEFRLLFQPIVDVTTARTVAFEALVRWQHPTRGLLAPDAFIAVAESCGVIVPLGDWILREACRHAATWPAPIRVAVNLSPAQLGRATLLDTVQEALADAALAPDRLEFEITEALFLAREAHTIQFLSDARALGIGIALDDFGTGFSSLNYLTQYPVSKIKIDRSFVSGGASVAHRSAIIEAVTLLAGRLGCVTTAEGVESAHALSWVASLGCTQAQGYLFARPLDPLAIEAYLAHENDAAADAETLPLTEEPIAL